VADQHVEIMDHDPGWAARFAEQRTAVQELLRPWLAGPVEHIGSTAVPGLRAKPVIDMLAPVGSLAEARAAVPTLAEAGWLSGQRIRAVATGSGSCGRGRRPALITCRSSRPVTLRPGRCWPSGRRCARMRGFATSMPA